MVLHLTFNSSLKLWSHLFSVDKLGPFRIAAVGELPDLPALISHAVLWHFCCSLIDLLLLSALLFCGSLGQLLLWKAFGKEGQPTLNGWLRMLQLHPSCMASVCAPSLISKLCIGKVGRFLVAGGIIVHGVQKYSWCDRSTHKYFVLCSKQLWQHLLWVILHTYH